MTTIERPEPRDTRPDSGTPRRSRMAIPVIGRLANALILGLGGQCGIVCESPHINTRHRQRRRIAADLSATRRWGACTVHLDRKSVV